MIKSFRHTAGFGKRMEYYIIGLMLKEGIDIYVPLVDDNGVDAIIKKKDGTYCEVQIKARSNEVKLGDGALFSAINHEFRKGYWFIFYSQKLDTLWVISSEDFVKESVLNKSGKNIGKRSIKFNGTRTEKKTGEKYEYLKERYEKYVVKDFNMFK
ncbi:hypothetical protein [Bacillus cereus]|uniref:hypothetical protein n=1 Tax=Bacillus cereus TaxID=1396 RepID=UPI001443B61A|nr:hypothetical protein [Bacillus cereus]